MEIWVLGATGRSGRAIVAALRAVEVEPVPVGRDAGRLAAAFPDAAETIALGSVEAMAAGIRRRRPDVVVNTVGPFSETAVPVARACLPTTHYLDLANDATTFTALAALHDEAVAAGRGVVPGAGFGVAATESVVVALCADRPAPVRVRIDMVPSLASEEDVVGEALAATLVDVLRRGGAGSGSRTLTLPDGSSVTTGAVPFGDRVAAQWASGAPSVVAGSTLVPTGLVVRTLLPVVGAALSIPGLAGVARRRLAAIRMPARERPREHSYGHAVVEWADGTTREGWLQAGDASDFTSAIAAGVATGLAEGRGRPGVHGPTSALGLDLVAAAGAELR